MHKDKPPGLFDLNDRPLGHTIRLGLGTGVILSFLIHGGLTVWRADSGVARPRPTAQEAEQAMTAHKKPGTPSPAPQSAVGF